MPPIAWFAASQLLAFLSLVYDTDPPLLFARRGPEESDEFVKKCGYEYSSTYKWVNPNL